MSNPLYDFGNEVNAVLSTAIAATAWLAQRGYLDLAIQMRDEFMEMWEIDRGMWNDALANAVDYAHRKAPHPDAIIRTYMELAVA